jgi:hypothetical protein
MKTFFLFLSLLLLNLSLVKAQTTSIEFTYDAAGNQTKREICFGCSGRMSNQPIKTAETLTEDDLIKDDLYDQISYYPNPVKEELYVKWVNTETHSVHSIELYALSGQFIKDYKNLKGIDMTTIAFENYPQGFYNLVLIYSNGEKKTLKIVKK